MIAFASGNKRYRIKRTIKKKGSPSVDLILPDGATMDDKKNIESKIIDDIVGVTRDQFAQIVMIAQNDFLRFLQSGTKERLEILRRIFGTEELKQFQNKLIELVKEEKNTREMILRDFERHEVDAYRREEQFAEWESQIKANKAELSEADKQLSKYDKQKQTLAANLAVAEELCKKFSDLAAVQHDIEKHNAKAGEIKEIKTRAARGEISLRKVKPLADEVQKAAENHTIAQAGLLKAKEQETAANTELEEAANAINTLPPLANAQDAFAALSKEWEVTAEKLNRLTDLQTNRNEITGK